MEGRANVEHVTEVRNDHEQAITDTQDTQAGGLLIGRCVTWYQPRESSERNNTCTCRLALRG